MIFLSPFRVHACRLNLVFRLLLTVILYMYFFNICFGLSHKLRVCLCLCVCGCCGVGRMSMLYALACVASLVASFERQMFTPEQLVATPPLPGRYPHLATRRIRVKDNSWKICARVLVECSLQGFFTFAPIIQSKNKHQRAKSECVCECVKQLRKWL